MFTQCTDLNTSTANATYLSDIVFLKKVLICLGMDKHLSDLSVV